MREVRISPDGNMVAVRSDWPADNWNAWGVMHAVNGGHWSDTNAVADWPVATAGAPATPPAPEPEPEPEPPVDPDE
jgi:hypothetical protein